MSHKPKASYLKLSAMFVFAWVALVVLINFFMYMSLEDSYSLKQAVQLLPLTGLLCFFPALYMLADYVRVERNGH